MMNDSFIMAFSLIIMGYLVFVLFFDNIILTALSVVGTSISLLFIFLDNITPCQRKDKERGDEG